MKKSLIFSLIIAAATINTVSLFTSCEKENKLSSHNRSNEITDITELAPEDIICVFPEEELFRHEDTVISDSELPPEEFIGTIIGEELEYIIVEPNRDEKEYGIANKIRIDFIKTEHKDYLYGTGRKVHITYIPDIRVTDGIGYISTDLINTEGYEDFELFTVENGKENANFVLNNSEISQYNSDINLYYYGLEEVFITVDGKTLTLDSALRSGKVTLNGILSKCNTLASLGEIQSEEYKDGGSKIYRFDNFSILKFHTLDGNRDIYIGNNKLDINSALSSKHLFIGIHDIYGLDIHAMDVSSSGATLIFEKRQGCETGTLQFGEYYKIEMLTQDGWQKVPYKDGISEDNLGWHQLAYLISDSYPYTEFKLDWSFLYGELDTGIYRIVKEITDFRTTGDYDKFQEYCYFEINNWEN